MLINSIWRINNANIAIFYDDNVKNMEKLLCILNAEMTASGAAGMADLSPKTPSATGRAPLTNALQPEDVYSDRTYAAPGAAPGFLESWIVSVTVERSASALPRVFGLLGTLDVVPDSSRSDLADHALTIVLTFAEVRHSTVDRLYRKLQQLPETIGVSVRVTIDSGQRSHDAHHSPGRSTATDLISA
jgi:hypothetical protein